MFLDLSVTFVLISDFLKLISSHIESGSFSISTSFLIFLISLIVTGIFAWRTTYIPDLPPVPRPPYVIQISSTPTLNNNGEHNTLADVRLLSSGVDVDHFRRNFVITRGGSASASLDRLRLSGTRVSSTGGNSSTGADSSQNQTQGVVGGGEVLNSSSQGRTQISYRQTRVHQRAAAVGQATSGAALLQGLLRPGSVIRPLLQRASGEGNQVIVYHRVNVYHHHHHHHHSENGSQTASAEPLLSSSQVSADQTISDQPQAALSLTDPNLSSSEIIPDQQQSNRSSRSHSVDSSTQYEYVDANVDDTESFEQLIENPSGVDVLLNAEDAIDSSLSSHIEENGRIIENRGPQVTSDVDGGLRLRRSTAYSDISSTNNSTLVEETSQTTVPIAMDKSETDQSPRQEIPASSPGVDDIRFTIKFLNDTSLEVTTQPEEKILDFKRRHFSTELSENKTVRLIFNGRVLDNDASTLRESGIFDQCVVHCLIVSRPPPPSASGSSAGSRGSNDRANNGGILGGGAADPGLFFVGFLGVFLTILWVVCFNWGSHLFSQSAVISLTLLTLIFGIGLVAFYLPVHPANAG